MTSQPFGTSPFVAAPISTPVAAITPPVEVRVGDDWPFQFNITDPTGKPIDLTGMIVGNPIGGATVGAELFGASVANPAVIAGVNGSLQIVDAVHGVVSGVVSRALTALVPAQKPNSTTLPVRLSVFIIDTLWRKHTFPPIVLLPLRPSDVAAIPTQPQQITLTMGVQGPAGASSSLTADQIAQLDADTLVAAEAYTDQRIAGLPDTETIASGLIRAALVAYATKVDVAGAVEQATAGLVTTSDVQQAIQAFFNAQVFAPTGDALNALIDARVVNYLQQTASLIGGAQAIATATGSLQMFQVLAGSVQTGAAISAALNKSLVLGGVANGAAMPVGTASISVPLVGAVAAAAIASGNLITQVPGSISLMGQVQATAVATGSVAQSVSLAGAALGQGSAQGLLTLSTMLSGDVPASAAVTGQVAKSNVLGGSVSAIAVAAGSLVSSNLLGGQTTASATPIGFMSRDLTLAGQAVAPASTTGSIRKINTSPLFYAGFLGASSAPAGSPIYTGVAAAMPTIVGNLSLSKILTGASLAQANATGALTTAANANRSPIFAFGLLGAGY